MEANQNENNENREMYMSQETNLFRPTRKERIKQKAKDVINIIISVIAHQFKIAFLITAISLIVIILLCSAALYILQENSLDKIFEMLSM